MNLKANFFVVPITLAVVAIVAIILGVCSQNWVYYVIGGLLGLMNHGLMVKQNARTFRFAKLDPDHTTFQPKKSAILWYLLRCVLFLGIFIALGYKSFTKGDRNTAIVEMVIALSGYLTMKIIFIICLLCFKDKEKKVIEQ